ncbi:hypothetical protein T4D_13974 [Trichinella pseudospiralis]|uniref:Uncharacterized protein n=1 Tax=Trichinella pseudospiralis TaxID=6337 RepID=A0A0V1FX30_TRIPS|nr:hypothetical protein T4D_13974 [Trichinella pseudospiralis]
MNNSFFLRQKVLIDRGDKADFQDHSLLKLARFFSPPIPATPTWQTRSDCEECRSTVVCNRVSMQKNIQI